MSETMKLTPASTWRQQYEDGIEVVLPSGHVVKMRSVSLGYLLRTEKLPSQLTSIALGAASIDVENPKSDEAEKMSEILSMMDDYYRVLCQESFVYPKVVDDEPQSDDEISYAWISEHDKHKVEEILNTPVGEWKNFR